MENKEFQTLIVSLLVHGLLAYFLINAKTPQLPTSSTVPVEIVFADKSKTNAQTFVTETEEQATLEKLKEQAKYLSKLSKRVKEQMTARNHDDNTANRTKSLNLKPNLMPNPQRAAGMEQQQQQQQTESQGEINLRKAQQGFGKSIAISDSSLGEYIPNVKVGNFTALNTDQFLFYTFFARVNEAIRYRWVSHVRNFAFRLPVMKQNELAQYARTTYVHIMLDRNGKLVRSFVEKSSGSEGLDMAALQAFREAAPLQNPPAEMLEEDGLIHLQYSFHVEWRPTTVASP